MKVHGHAFAVSSSLFQSTDSGDDVRKSRNPLNTFVGGTHEKIDFKFRHVDWISSEAAHGVNQELAICKDSVRKLVIIRAVMPRVLLPSNGKTT